MQSILLALIGNIQDIRERNRDVFSISKCFNKACEEMESKKIRSVNYTLYPDCLTKIADYLHIAVHSNPTEDTLLRFRSGEITFSEFDLLYSISALQLPMDYQFRSTAHNGIMIPLHNVLTTLCERALKIFQNQNLTVSEKEKESKEKTDQFTPYAYIDILQALTQIDIDSSPELKKVANELIAEVTKHAYSSWLYRSEPWTGNQTITLLRLLSIHSFEYEGSDLQIQKIYSWRPTIQGMLLDLEKWLTTSFNHFELTAVSARQLFQVYTHYYQFREEFPPELFKEMAKFLPEFKAASHGSGFEDKIRQDFISSNGIFDKLKQLCSWIDWPAIVNFSNPTTEFGLEPDILLSYSNPKINFTLKVVAQVDGRIYHSCPVYYIENQKVDKRTRFRDHNFKQAGIETFVISDRGGDYRSQIFDFIKEKFIIPIFEAHFNHASNKIVEGIESATASVESCTKKVKERKDSLSIEFAQITELEKKLMDSKKEIIELAQLSGLSADTVDRKTEKIIERFKTKIKTLKEQDELLNKSLKKLSQNNLLLPLQEKKEQLTVHADLSKRFTVLTKELYFIEKQINEIYKEISKLEKHSLQNKIGQESVRLKKMLESIKQLFKTAGSFKNQDAEIIQSIDATIFNDKELDTLLAQISGVEGHRKQQKLKKLKPKLVAKLKEMKAESIITEKLKQLSEKDQENSLELANIDTSSLHESLKDLHEQRALLCKQVHDIDVALRDNPCKQLLATFNKESNKISKVVANADSLSASDDQETLSDFVEMEVYKLKRELYENIANYLDTNYRSLARASFKLVNLKEKCSCFKPMVATDFPQIEKELREGIKLLSDKKLQVKKEQIISYYSEILQSEHPRCSSFNEQISSAQSLQALSHIEKLLMEEQRYREHGQERMRLIQKYQKVFSKKDSGITRIFKQLCHEAGYLDLAEIEGKLIKIEQEVFKAEKKIFDLSSLTNRLASIQINIEEEKQSSSSYLSAVAGNVSVGSTSAPTAPQQHPWSIHCPSAQRTPVIGYGGKQTGKLNPDSSPREPNRKAKVKSNN